MTPAFGQRWALPLRVAGSFFQEPHQNKKRLFSVPSSKESVSCFCSPATPAGLGIA